MTAAANLEVETADDAADRRRRDRASVVTASHASTWILYCASHRSST